MTDRARAARPALSVRPALAACAGALLAALSAAVASDGWVPAPPPRGAPGLAAAATPATGDAADALKVEAARRAQEAYFRDNPQSPLRAVRRFDFPQASGEKDPEAIVGSDPGAAIRLDGPVPPRALRLAVLPPESDGAPSRFRLERLDPKAEIRVAETPWDGRTRIVPEETLVEIAPFALRLYVQSGNGIVIVFDSRRTAGGAFAPPMFYPYDPSWSFRATLHRYPEARTLSLLTSLGRTKDFRRVGYFEVAPGASAPDAAPRTMRVEAYQPLFAAPAGESLMILFTDETTGRETYGTGRYLDLGPPSEGLYALDFNRAYNPLCAYTGVYNCPIPPRENALPVAVRAGEKTYPAGAHR